MLLELVSYYLLSLAGLLTFRRDKLAKVLVFSQYHRMLELVSRALSENKVSHLHLNGSSAKTRAKQIDKFQNDPNCTVFLLSLRTNNSGLTLVSATCVFLMEPSLNPSQEAQAINRIFRIGQTRETHVFKFMMKNSVEQTIEEMAHAGGEKGGLLTQTKESMSVHQLLRVLQLADDKKEETEQRQEDKRKKSDAVGAATTQAEMV
jgi:SNF2 family DNA or RNA helicase